MISSSSVISKGSKGSSNQDLATQSNDHSSNVSKPKKSPRFTKPPTTTGRKFINKSDNQENNDKNTVKINENTTIEELDQMLEDDALILLNMKKDITRSQKDELLKLQQVVLNIKKEYDIIRASNSSKEKYVQSITDKKIALNGIEKSDQEVNANVNQNVLLFNEQIKATSLELAEEQKTIKMLTLMIKRLDSEIGQCRIETSQLVIQADQAKHDADISHTSLVALKQELLEEESQLSKINATLKVRKEEREAKIQVLHQMSVEGENSVVRMQQSLFESSKRTEERQRKRYLLLNPNSTNRREAWKKLSEFTEEREDEFANLTDTNIAKKLTLNQIKDIIQRYTTQTSRIEKLKQLDIELRNNIISQEKRKIEFSDQLAFTADSLQKLASKRQVYQEVDLKDFALATTIKECDDCKERDFRLKLSIASLKQSIPRFLSKVTKEDYSLPSEIQLPAAIMELVDELTKLIKAIAPALLKDATPDDLALISMQSGGSTTGGSSHDAQSEFDRLQRLPGYSRLQRQLFYNLMTAKTDNTSQNVRIDQVGKVKQPKTTTGPAALYEDPTINPMKGKRLLSMYKSNVNQSEDDNSKNGNNNDVKSPGHDIPTLGRKTIKNISKLIYDRDHNKVNINARRSSKPI